MNASIKTFKIAIFTGGMNLRDPKISIKPPDAYIVSGYKCYPSRLRAMSTPLPFATLDANVHGLHNWQNSTYEERVIATTDSNIYSIDASGTATSIIGAVAMTNGITASCPFNDYLFLCNGTDAVVRISRALACSNPGFTGPSSDAVLNQVWSYNGRLYFVEEDSASFWYAEESAVAGALTEVPLETIFNDPGILLFGSSWSSNAGSGNEVYNVLVSSSGEVLIYSGLYPDSVSWQVVARTRVAEPIGRRSFCRIGGDIAIYTKRGVVLLSEALSKAAEPSSLYHVTDKLSKLFEYDFSSVSVPTKAVLCADRKEPFLYVKGGFFQGGVSNAILIQNLQNGAWSLNAAFLGTDQVNCLAHAFGWLLLGDSQNNRVYYCPLVLTTGSLPRDILTGWFDFGSPAQKHIKAIRLLSGNIGDNTSYTTTYTVGVSSDEQAQNDTTSEASQSKDVVSAFRRDGTVTTEFDNIGLCGKKFRFSITATSEEGAEEIHGLEIDYEVGELP